VPWIGIKDATENHGRLIYDTYQHTNALGIANSSARILPARTVCLSRTASVGYVVVMGAAMATSQDFVDWVCSDAIDYRFLKYVLLAERQAFLRFASGTTHQTIYFPEVKAFHVGLPPINEQAAIADILSTLDNKIELYRRMNETLQEIATALFNSWFVDFDPVRAKATGRGTSLPGRLTDLLPVRLVDSELGDIPEGWGTGRVDDEFDITMGQSPPGNTYNEVGNGQPFYQGRTDFGFRFPIRRVYCTSPTRHAKAHDTLVSVRAPVGDVNMAAEDCAIGRGVAAVRDRTGSCSYTYHFMRSLQAAFAQFNAEGTVFGSIGKKDFQSMPCLLAPRDFVTHFESRIGPLDRRVELNEREARTLSALRDKLLPRLISGELRVKNADKLIGSAV
jgi:type I restriction enzyme S subunit